MARDICHVTRRQDLALTIGSFVATNVDRAQTLLSSDLPCRCALVQDVDCVTWPMSSSMLPWRYVVQARCHECTRTLAGLRVDQARICISDSTTRPLISTRVDRTRKPDTCSLTRSGDDPNVDRSRISDLDHSTGLPGVARVLATTPSPSACLPVSRVSTVPDATSPSALDS